MGASCGRGASCGGVEVDDASSLTEASPADVLVVASPRNSPEVPQAASRLSAASAATLRPRQRKLVPPVAPRALRSIIRWHNIRWFDESGRSSVGQSRRPASVTMSTSRLPQYPHVITRPQITTMSAGFAAVRRSKRPARRRIGACRKSASCIGPIGPTRKGHAGRLQLRTEDRKRESDSQTRRVRDR